MLPTVYDVRVSHSRSSFDVLQRKYIIACCNVCHRHATTPHWFLLATPYFWQFCHSLASTLAAHPITEFGVQDSCSDRSAASLTASSRAVTSCCDLPSLSASELRPARQKTQVGGRRSWNDDTKKNCTHIGQKSQGLGIFPHWINLEHVVYASNYAKLLSRSGPFLFKFNVPNSWQQHVSRKIVGSCVSFSPC